MRREKERGRKRVEAQKYKRRLGKWEKKGKEEEEEEEDLWRNRIIIRKRKKG